MADIKKDLSQKIVFFDGVCHLCNGFVDFVIQNETLHGSLVFAPLQGETAKVYLSEKDRSSLESVVFWNQDQIFHRSEAVIEIFKNLKSPWRWLGVILQAVPPVLRNQIYLWVARHRYKWFGTRNSCRLPRPEERHQLWP